MNSIDDFRNASSIATEGKFGEWYKRKSDEGELLTYAAVIAHDLHLILKAQKEVLHKLTPTQIEEVAAGLGCDKKQVRKDLGTLVYYRIDHEAKKIFLIYQTDSIHIIADSDPKLLASLAEKYNVKLSSSQSAELKSTITASAKQEQMMLAAMMQQQTQSQIQMVMQQQVQNQIQQQVQMEMQNQIQQQIQMDIQNQIQQQIQQSVQQQAMMSGWM